MGGTSGLHPNIIDVVSSIFLKHKAHEFVIHWSSSQPTAKCLTCQHMVQPYTQQNDLITALTKPQPTKSSISIGDDQIVVLQKLATIFQTSITKQPISAPGVPDIAPPNDHTHEVKQKSLLMQP